MKIKITSAVVIDGKIVKSGQSIEIAEKLGKELVSRGKAESLAKDEAKAEAEANGKAKK